MRVAYFALAPFISGSERSLQMLLSYAPNKNIIPILISPKTSPMHAWAKAKGIKSYGIDINYISPLRNPIKWINQQYQLYSVLSREKIDLVHSNQIWSFPSMRYVASVLKLPKVCHFRDPLDSDSNWWLSPGADSAICISNHIKNQYENFITEKNRFDCHTLINPVEIPQSSTPAELKKSMTAARSKLGLPENTRVLGYIGQISEVKGVYELIETVSSIADDNWHLVIAGKDPSENQEYLKKCKNLISERNIDSKITLLGFVEEIESFYSAVDLVVMYSKEEPLGRVPLEAGAHYTPTLASKVGGLPETIIHRQTGWLESETSPEQRAINLTDILSEDLTTYGSRAREFAETTSHPEKYIERLTNIYRTLI